MVVSVAVFSQRLFRIVGRSFLALAFPAHAGPYEDGLTAYQRGDYATAVTWFRKAADQGVAIAQVTLGLMHAEGEGVPQDYAEAVKWLRKAAKQGLVEAQTLLGFMYHDGEGVPQDIAEAVKWWRMAVEQGDVDAQYNLGHMYREGRGVSQDYVCAHMWYNLAAALGHDCARDSCDLLAKCMTLDQVAEAQRMAREWLAKHE